MISLMCIWTGMEGRRTDDDGTDDGMDDGTDGRTEDEGTATTGRTRRDGHERTDGLYISFQSFRCNIGINILTQT